MSPKAKVYVALACAAGLGAWLSALSSWQPESWFQAVFYLSFTVLTSTMKVRIPGTPGSLSVNYVFILLAVAELSLLPALLVALAGTLAQSWIRAASQPTRVQVVFNVSAVSACVWLSYLAFHNPQLRAIDDSPAIRLFWASLTYFLSNTLWVSGIIGIIQKQGVLRVWKDSFLWTAPQYLLGAALTLGISLLNHSIGWQYTVLVFPGIYVLYRSYHIYLSKVEEEKRHAVEMADLHLRTIEALALAIDAKDDTTHAHLCRVQTYAVQIARDLGLSALEIKAIEAAALLHDIGKLAVPEYILNKPGRLTQAEFERVKLHPVVGAEILECVQFPYPVVPIVRCHHEKWDGSGYPDGLKGEEIPMGARILAAVDCLDALASDRQYRKAMPLQEAIAYVKREAGRSFDPKVVEILERRAEELEEKVKLQPSRVARLSTRARIERGEAPAAGLVGASRRDTVRGAPARPDFIASIAAARQEFQVLHEMTRDLGNSLSMEDTLGLLAARLKRLVPFDAIVIRGLRDQNLVPLYVDGHEAELFRAVEIPVGQGLAGWVVVHRKAILNGIPNGEAGFGNGLPLPSSLRSALIVPLEGPEGGFLGALAVYRREADAFTNDHLRILQTISSKVALTIENALMFRRVEQRADTDQLTGLANAPALFLFLQEQMHNRRAGGRPLTVLLMDLDGFKQVNDRFGHLQGNRILKATADLLRRTFRESDFIARLGGDEFVVVMPDAAGPAAQERIDRIRSRVCTLGKELIGEPVLSVSVGSATFEGGDTDVETLLGEADKRMYSNKQKTRERAPAPASDLASMARCVQPG